MCHVLCCPARCSASDTPPRCYRVGRVYTIADCYRVERSAVPGSPCSAVIHIEGRSPPKNACSRWGASANRLHLPPAWKRMLATVASNACNRGKQCLQPWQAMLATVAKESCNRGKQCLLYHSGKCASRRPMPVACWGVRLPLPWASEMNTPLGHRLPTCVRVRQGCA